MEPPIQYTQTSDGVSIAYYAIGQGRPLISMGLPNSHIQLEWRTPEVRRNYELAARVWKFVRYDHRGFGLSDRGVTDFSIDALVRDLEAVIERVAPEMFQLIANDIAPAVAIAYAARHRERLSHLVLMNAAPAGLSMSNEQIDALVAMAENDWELASESIMHALVGWSQHEAAQASAARLREAVTPSTLISFIGQAREWDVRSLLPLVTVPTLVLHHRHSYFGVEIARALASGIPDARLVLVEGPQGGLGPEGLAAILAFLRERDVGSLEALIRESDQPPERPPVAAPGMAVILFADIVDSTALTEQLGDATFRGKARELDASLRSVISNFQGTAVEGKLVGDGLMAVFTSARQAIEAALKCGKTGASVGLRLHLGIHAGDVIREGNNVYGGAVNIAARIAAASAPGEVLVSDTIRSLARTSAGVTFDDRDEHELKGVADPQRLFAVREREA